MPQLYDLSLRRFHAAEEVVGFHTLGIFRQHFGVVVFALLDALERSDVLFNEEAERIDVESTGKEEVEVAGSVEAFGIDAAHSFVVGLGQGRHT